MTRRSLHEEILAMRSRKHVTEEAGLTTLIEATLDPSLTAERQAELRARLHDLLGAAAGPVLRFGARAMADRRAAEQAEERYQRLVSGSQLRGIVTGVHNGRVRVLVSGAERDLARPESLGLDVGQTVLMDADGRALLGAGEYLVGGWTYAFCERLEGRHALVRPLREGPEDDARQLALVSAAVDLDGLAPDDRVLGWSIDGGNVVLVTRRLGQVRPAARDDVGTTRPVAREDIVGLDGVLERVGLLFLEPPSAEYAAMLQGTQNALRGVVFQGPPGTGKTLLADYLVGQVRARGGRALYRMASFYLSKWVGVGAAAVRADFEMLEEAYLETGVRPLLVVDEIEAIALDRHHAAALSGGHLDVLDTLLGVLTKSSARMIGISNVADRVLDTALTRDGRLPIVRFPATLDAEQTAALVCRCLAGVPLATEEDEA